MSDYVTKASSIDRALDQVGDKWSLLIIQELFWGINSFSDMLSATGVSRGVLADRLEWLQSVDCIEKVPSRKGGRRLEYRLTQKTQEFYDVGLMAMVWERQYYSTPELDGIALTHLKCGQTFRPQQHCRHCSQELTVHDVSCRRGPGATNDSRPKKKRRRSSVSMVKTSSKRAIYKNLISILGEPWTASVIVMGFQGFSRFDQFQRELPAATNILTDRLKLLVEHGIFEQVAYQNSPLRYEYKLTQKGEAMFPFFVTLLQWGDKWCDSKGQGKPMKLRHDSCEHALTAQVKCSECGGVLKIHDVVFEQGAN